MSVSEEDTIEYWQKCHAMEANKVNELEARIAELEEWKKETLRYIPGAGELREKWQDEMKKQEETIATLREALENLSKHAGGCRVGVGGCCDCRSNEARTALKEAFGEE